MADYREGVGEWSSLEEWWQEVGEAELRLILWAAWDPIGRVPRDEYDWYVPQLWALLREHALLLRETPGYDELPDAEQEELADRAIASEAKIALQLSEWRTGHIGLPPRPDDDRVVAMKLSDWLSPPGADEFSPADLAG
jgi:hypothetical protein